MFKFCAKIHKKMAAKRKATTMLHKVHTHTIIDTLIHICTNTHICTQKQPIA